MIAKLAQISLYAVVFGALLAAPALGQGRGQQGQGRPGAEGNNARGNNALSAILRMIQESPPASLVVLDAGEVGWGGQVSSLLQQDPLVVLNLNFIPLDATGGAGLELIQREGWPAGAPRWCLIAANGYVLFSSGQAPDPESIMAAFRGAGLQSRLDILRQFLFSYPEHAEARLALLDELRAVAEAKTRSVLGIAATIFEERSGVIVALGQNEPPQQLDAGIDSDIWGEYARESDNAFQLGLWKQDSNQLFGGTYYPGFGGFVRGAFLTLSPRGGGTPMVSRLGQHSPMMARLYRRWLPDVEYALGKRPSSNNMWNLWLSVQRSAGKSDLKALQSGLVPGPNDSLREIPPSFVRTQWIQDCINRGDLLLAEEVARDAWENFLDQTPSPNRGRPGQGRPDSPFGGGRGDAINQIRGNDSSSIFDARVWNTEAEPYIEVLLRLQKTGTADGIVQQWFGNGGWTGAAMRARNLANRLGYADLGARWATLAPQGQQRQQTLQGPQRR